MGLVFDGLTNELHFVTLVAAGLVSSSGIMHHVKYHDIPPSYCACAQMVIINST